MRQICFVTVMACCAALIFPAANCRAGLGWTTGKEWHLWTEGRYSVIVARVVDVAPTKDIVKENGTHRATLEPIFALAGSLDPSEHPTLAVTFSADGMTSSTRSPPPKGSTVLAVMQGTHFIVSDICTFMPDSLALVVVKDLDDPRILETLKRLQEARAHPDPDPYGKPATRPAK